MVALVFDFSIFEPKKHKKVITRTASAEKPNGVLGKILTDKKIIR